MGNKCHFCQQDARDPHQYFMVNDPLWQDFCFRNAIPGSAIVCADCFESKLGRKLTPRDLFFCPINYQFLRERYPQEFDLFNLGVKYLP
jgi:hypothetical protein